MKQLEIILSKSFLQQFQNFWKNIAGNPSEPGALNPPILNNPCLTSYSLTSTHRPTRSLEANFGNNLGDSSTHQRYDFQQTNY